MKFTRPAGHNAIDAERVVTRPHVRVEAPLKVTGQAVYSDDVRAEGDTDLSAALAGVVVTAPIARGRIVSIDAAAVQAMPGVRLVLTHDNMPPQRRAPVPAVRQEGAQPQLAGRAIHHHGQAVALVVADTFEQARDAAHRLSVVCRARDGGVYRLADAALGRARPHADAKDSVVGDFERAFAQAPVRVDARYTTPAQMAAAMEPHASVAHWQGGRLTLHTAHQVMHWVHDGVAATLKIPKARVRVVSRFVGGGFGSKLTYHADAVLAAAASRRLGAPVRVALARHQLAHGATHRSATQQRVRLAARADGRLLAIAHESWSGNQPGGDIEPACEPTKYLYAAPHRLIRTRLAELHLPSAGSMRAPGEAVGLLALECALDELAERLRIDPVELRLLNDTAHDPAKGPKRPFSQRRLARCLTLGAERFGWERRVPQPGMLRDGDWLVGLGVASAFRTNLTQASGARVRLQADGTLVVETQMTDIGTGSATVLAQTAAEMFGLRADQVDVRLGDTDFPKASGSGGSWGANSATAGVFAACEALQRLLARRLKVAPADLAFADGQVITKLRQRPLAGLAGARGLAAEGRIEFGELDQRYAQASFGAHFAEVGVDAHTGEIRVRRLLSVVSAGRILNPVTARSQCLGGMTMGIGGALMEQLEVDPRFGCFVNHDLAEYHVPVHADVPSLDVVFLDERDELSSPMKARGVGELGIAGVGAAVANAVWHASGVRVRDFPVTLDKVLAGWGARRAV